LGLLHGSYDCLNKLIIPQNVTESQKVVILSTFPTDDEMYDPDNWYNKWQETKWIDDDRIKFYSSCGMKGQGSRNAILHWDGSWSIHSLSSHLSYHLSGSYIFSSVEMVDSMAAFWDPATISGMKSLFEQLYSWLSVQVEILPQRWRYTKLIQHMLNLLWRCKLNFTMKQGHNSRNQINGKMHVRLPEQLTTWPDVFVVGSTRENTCMSYSHCSSNELSG